MASFKGIDVRQTADRLMFRASLKDSSGAKVTSGTTTLRIFEIQTDGSLSMLDFNDGFFTIYGPVSPTLALTHRTTSNGTYDTGIWTGSITNIANFTVGNIYITQISNSNASPPDQEREFQFGSEQGDGGAFTEFTVAADSTTTVIKTNRSEVNGWWDKSIIAFISGPLKGLARKTVSFTGWPDYSFQVSSFPVAPLEGDRGIIIGVVE